MFIIELHNAPHHEIMTLAYLIFFRDAVKGVSNALHNVWMTCVLFHHWLQPRKPLSVGVRALADLAVCVCVCARERERERERERVVSKRESESERVGIGLCYSQYRRQDVVCNDGSSLYSDEPETWRMSTV